MNKRVRVKEHSKKSTLFLRIMLGLSLPLLCLTVIFAALQLSGDMKAIHRSYQIESRFAFEVIQRTLELASHNAHSPESMEKIIKELQETHKQTHMSIYDLYEQKISFDLEPLPQWDVFDEQALENSLYEYQQKKKPYIVRANREEEKLVAYIPLQLKNQGIRMVIRVQFPIPNLQDALVESRGTLISMVLLILVAGIVMGSRLSNSIVKPILKLNAATEEIMKGNLDQKVHIKTGDEIESLSNTFNKMSEAIKAMKKEAQDANPLSGLPGNQGIFRDLKRRIHERSKFVLFHTDLDRFKF
jgi:HAMP domain-containing protein